MKQVERASIMRIVSDLIKADGIIDSREISVLQSIREKYGIKKEDEVLSTSITLASAIAMLKDWDDGSKHNLMTNFLQLVMSDNYCDRSEALLILVLRCCMTINIGVNASVISVDTVGLNFEESQILYIESAFEKTINNQINQYYRELCAEARLSGFDFVYLPKISEHYKSISESDLMQLAEFLYPKVSHWRGHKINLKNSI